MSLATLQRAFQAAVTAEDGAADAPPDPGLAVYRHAYRARLLECLRSGFDKTWTWIGDEAFAAAACHHVIVHRPHSWTLDDVGHGFDATLAELFPDDHEVADLAWLEWAMQEVFTAPDVKVLEPGAFAALTAAYTEADWRALRLRLVPGIAMRAVVSDCAALEHAIGANRSLSDWMLESPQTVLVWRQDLRSRCRLLDTGEALALACLADGACFESLCERLVSELGPAGVAAAGTFLSRWLIDGLLLDAPTPKSTTYPP